METEYQAKQELTRDLANYKKAYRKNDNLPKEIARNLAQEIRALEQLLRKN